MSRIVLGILAIPDSITEPRKGKWWDENRGQWVETNLEEEEKRLKSVPEDDDDILGRARAEGGGGCRQTCSHEVKESYYYDVLQVEPSASKAQIRKQYYHLARKYHPDKVGKDDKEAAEKFKQVSEAYQVLSDPEMRKNYDKLGQESLSPDQTSTAAAEQIDPAMLFAFLFGSDKFSPYIGVLATATSASIADSKSVHPNNAKLLQKRRCTRLAISLAQRLQSHVQGHEKQAIALWTSQAKDLVTASYGYQLLQVIGQVYSLCAVEFLGSLDSGIGLPSVTHWARSRQAQSKRSTYKSSQCRNALFAGLSVLQTTYQYQQAIRTASTPDHRDRIHTDYRNHMAQSLLNVLWTTTVVDITSTLHETSQMLLFDVSIDKDTRKKRALALKALGNTFLSIPPPQQHGDHDAAKLYEQAAFAAMLETIKRRDEAAFNASFRNK